MALSTTQNDILALFNLESEDVQDISYVNTNNMAVIHISLRANYPPCTDCGNTDVKIKGYELKKINHSMILLFLTYIHICSVKVKRHT